MCWGVEVGEILIPQLTAVRPFPGLGWLEQRTASQAATVLRSVPKK
jgi:hypothetical protein